LSGHVERNEILSKLEEIEFVKKFAEDVYTYLKDNTLL